MKNRLRKPCDDCPFRRNSTPGWLGGAPPDWFVSAALADFYGHDPEEQAAPCHRTVDYSDPDWEEKTKDADACVGALIFYRNVDCFKLPRQPERSEMVCSVEPDHEIVFSTSEEFTDHHTSDRSMRSWEHTERSPRAHDHSER